MAITYRVSKTKNPQGVEGVNYFANKFVKTSDYTFEELAEDINNSTTVTQADAFAVLKAMKKYINRLCSPLPRGPTRDERRLRRREL